MLNRLTIHGFKSLVDTSVTLPRLAVLFGPPASGTSHLLDAIQALSRIGTLRTLSEALGEPMRCYPIETFSLPAGGMPELLSVPQARFSLEADLTTGPNTYRYRIAVAIEPGSGRLSVADEYLVPIHATGTPGGYAVIEPRGQKLRIRHTNKSAQPRQEPLGLDHAIVSDPRFGGAGYRAVEQTRQELARWRTYMLDPRMAMRTTQSPSDVQDIGVLGETLVSFLYKLHTEYPKHFQTVVRTLRSLIPSVEDLTVDLDERRGTLDIRVRQSGVDYSSRIVSEDILRVLALCAIAVNPWSGSLLAFEEPERGVHSRQFDLMAKLLVSLASEHNHQVVVTTHSPQWCDAMLHMAQSQSTAIGLFRVQRVRGATVVKPFDVTGLSFTDGERTTGIVEGLVLRGLLDDCCS